MSTTLALAQGHAVGVGGPGMAAPPAPGASARPAYGPGTVPNPGQLPAQPFGGASVDGRPRGRPASGPGAVPNPGQLARQPFSGSPGVEGPSYGNPVRERIPRGAVVVGGLGGDPGFATYGGDLGPDEIPPDAGYGPLPPLRVIGGVGPLIRCPPGPHIIQIAPLRRPRPLVRVVYGMPPCGFR